MSRASIFISMQILVLAIALLLFAAAVAGSHGRLYLFREGGEIVAIIIFFLILPLLYLILERRHLKHKQTLFSVAILLFTIPMAIIFIGLPGITNQFIVGKKDINSFLLVNGDAISIAFTLKPEMFERVSVEANINKTSGVEIKQLNVTVLNDNKEFVQPVFQPLAWDSLHYLTIEMNAFFEKNEFSSMNRFSISALYDIANTNALVLQVTCAYTRNGEEFALRKEFPVSITNHLTVERLIHY